MSGRSIQCDMRYVFSQAVGVRWRLSYFAECSWWWMTESKGDSHATDLSGSCVHLKESIHAGSEGEKEYTKRWKRRMERTRTK